MIEIYCLCPNCKGLTNGESCGDSEDEITCKKCKHRFPAHRIGTLEPFTAREVKPLHLYVHKYEYKEKIQIGGTTP